MILDQQLNRYCAKSCNGMQILPWAPPACTVEIVHIINPGVEWQNV